MTAIVLIATAIQIQAATIKGKIIDKTNREPLIGATVIVNESSHGTTTDASGLFEIDLRSGKQHLTISYISYVSRQIEIDPSLQHEELLIELEAEQQLISSVTVTARKNLESERSLQNERIASNVAIENMGAKEMSLKGISNVEEGVKKMTGMSVASAGQIIVRGLGDRYSITTLNGQPIASPNPDNKLIPLDIFPASTVKNVTVSKVFNATSFADYSGAHIDISTKEQTGDELFSIGVSLKGHTNTIGRDFYRMDHQSLFSRPQADAHAMECSLPDFRDYVKTKNIFDTDFSVTKRKALPAFGGNAAWSRHWKIGRQTLNLLTAGGIGNDYQTMRNAEFRLLEASGTTTDQYTYDSYASELKIAALASVGITLRTEDRIGYTFFYARNAVDTYMRREGFDQEDHHLIGSNDVMHIYSLMTHQFNGIHHLGQRWQLRWNGAYTDTASDEPDRRQVMFLKNSDNTLSLFKLNQQETMRYFGNLSEYEWNAHLATEYRISDRYKLTLGAAYKDKNRDYAATRFYYDLAALSPQIESIYDTNDYLNFGNVANGSLTINRHKQPKDSYEAGNEIVAGYISADLEPSERLLINIGVRYEQSNQWVEYYNDQSIRMRRDLKKQDLFPAINLRYRIATQHQIRWALSRTVTRPSFIEMAPFLYQESYGAAQIRGNEALLNGYNYNVDLRYEFLNSRGDMFSVTGYGKYLDSPIERVQMLAGGAAVHTFRNADHGLAAGVEIEFRKALTQELRVGINGSYMFTNVKLPEGGAYTNKERALQGASPYLGNADITWTPRFAYERQLSLSLLYNLQGERIHAVGISGLGDIKQRAVHTLDFVAAYRFNRKLELKAQLHDLLNRAEVFEQEIPQSGKTVEVERYKRGIGFELGLNLKF